MKAYYEYKDGAFWAIRLNLSPINSCVCGQGGKNATVQLGQKR